MGRLCTSRSSRFAGNTITVTKKDYSTKTEAIASVGKSFPPTTHERDNQ
jgi:hypothetical protein